MAVYNAAMSFAPYLRPSLPSSMCRQLVLLALSVGLAQTTFAAGTAAAAPPAAPAATSATPASASVAFAASAASAAVIIAGTPASSAHAASGAASPDAHRVSDMLMKKFGVAREKAQRISTAVMQSATKYSLPPALLLAIISIESRFKENAKGTHGATGLMQVVPGAHKKLVQNLDLNAPEPNIDAGSAILHGYLQSARGDVKTALKSYGGSYAYADKVTTTAQRFEPAVAVSEAAAQEVEKDAAEHGESTNRPH